MGRSIEEVTKEGVEIAKALGNGVRYAGPQMDKSSFVCHIFNDSVVINYSFSALSLEEARLRLTNKRKEFKVPLPVF